MILEARARYFGPVDAVQLAIELQEDDYSTAAPKLKEGVVKVLQLNDPMFTEFFYADDRVYWFDGDTNYDDPEDRGQFYFFLHHPPIQANMSIQVEVELSDGRVSTKRVPIEVDSDDSDWNNPMFDDAKIVEAKRDPQKLPYRDT
jgi:hypothetical protein